MSATTLGIYIHIPFCAKKCDYCDFYSLAGADGARMDDYLAALLRHMRETAALTGKNSSKTGGWSADTLYIGGGTPSLFGAQRVKKLVSAVKSLWNMPKSAEITMEANPDSLDFQSMRKLRKAGVNRLSIGVQATQPGLLASLGRIHTGEQAADCVRGARRAGFENISVDLMYGLPGQTTEMLFESINTVKEWGVTHLSLYGLKIEDGTPLAARNVSLPDEAEQADQYLSCAGLLKSLGFGQYEISNFALPSYQSRHNLKYWTLGSYIGFGAAAHSDFGGNRYGHVRDIDAYIAGVKSGDAVIDEISRISPLERAGEYIMLGLRTARGVSGNEYTRVYKVSFDAIEKKLEKFEKYGLCERTAERWHLTPKGFLVSNRILSELLESKVDGALAP
ncbi:MAG: radical SAM family heme chaperone HemW [Oscillospiraceae bacterium]|jgi:oxygen-independent coproporphyrinogen-3 oxidase|nr:radical SAM family heme chaperone HemW [Oscillospiraceae bacterium]